MGQFARKQTLKGLNRFASKLTICYKAQYKDNKASNLTFIMCVIFLSTKSKNWKMTGVQEKNQSIEIDPEMTDNGISR